MWRSGFLLDSAFWKQNFKFPILQSGSHLVGICLLTEMKLL
jgi:hypothetical protein